MFLDFSGNKFRYPVINKTTQVHHRDKIYNNNLVTINRVEYIPDIGKIIVIKIKIRHYNDFENLQRKS